MARKVVFLVNYDWFFVSHRLPLGRALRDRGWEVVVAASASPAAKARILAEGFRFEEVPFVAGGRSPVVEARTLAAVHALYRRERPDLTHHVTVKAVLYGSLAARATGVRAIVNAVSGLGYVFIDREKPSVSHSALRAGITAIYRAALGSPRIRTIFQNPDDRAFFVSHGLVREERTALIRGSGVDVSRFSETPLPAGPPLVVLPARMLWDKGVREFVHAATVVKRTIPAARFALVGGVDAQNPAGVPEAELAAWREHGPVEWWGHRTDMPEVLAEASLVVLPSYREGLPLVLVEAAARGRAAVATDVPGCREVVKDGDTGWLVPARDGDALAAAILAALLDVPELQRRSRNARELAVEELSEGRVVDATLAVYRSLGVELSENH